MSRKDYKKAAELVKGIVYNYHANSCEILSEKVAEYFIMLFSKDNPRFNAEKFLDACGLVR